ncbi:MAG: TIGR02281 family clan AA aspartic protease [Xanthobacteraceae bacterium]
MTRFAPVAAVSAVGPGSNAQGHIDVRQRLSLLLLFGLVVAVLIVLARQDGAGVEPLSTGDFASLAYKVGILVFIGGMVVTLFRERFVQAVTAALLWIAIGLVLVVGYSYRFEIYGVGDRLLAELVPGHVVSEGRTVAVARTNGGDFAINTAINGARVAMVLDTGASSVVLTREDAKRAGLPIEVLDYTVNIDTANGRTRAAPVTLDRIAVGSLVERSVDALVAQPGQLKKSLLGMSFLNRLQSWEVRGDHLYLRGYP